MATWRKRFAERRLDGLAEEPRPGAPRKIGDDKITEVVTTTLEALPQKLQDVIRAVVDVVTFCMLGLLIYVETSRVLQLIASGRSTSILKIHWTMSKTTRRSTAPHWLIINVLSVYHHFFF